MSLITVDAEGAFVIAWSDYREGRCPGCNIYAQRYSCDGVALGENFAVNSLSAYMNYSPAVAYKSNGEFVVAWGDGPHEAKSGHEPGVVPDRCASASEMASATRGTEPDIYVQQYSSDGIPIGSNFKVNDDTGNTYQEQPSLAVDANDDFVIAWHDNRNGEWDIYYQRYSSDGTPVGGNHRVEAGESGDDQRSASVSASESGAFVIAWSDDRNGDSDIYAQRFASDTVAVGSDFRVNSDFSTAYQYSPSVSASRTGEFVIAWSDRADGDWNVHAQRYSSDGGPFGESYRITDTDELRQIDPVVLLTNERIYATWTDNRGGQSGYDIWANALDWGFTVGIGNDLLPYVSSIPRLHQNSPNPFNSTTAITYDLHSPASVSLSIYDVSGRLVYTLKYGVQEETGGHTVSWHGRTTLGRDAPSGSYFCRLKAGTYETTRSMILAR